MALAAPAGRWWLLAMGHRCLSLIALVAVEVAGRLLLIILTPMADGEMRTALCFFFPGLTEPPPVLSL